MFYELVQRLHALHMSCVSSEFTFKLYKFTVAGVIVVAILKVKLDNFENVIPVSHDSCSVHSAFIKFQNHFHVLSCGTCREILDRAHKTLLIYCFTA